MYAPEWFGIKGAKQNPARRLVAAEKLSHGRQGAPKGGSIEEYRRDRLVLVPKNIWLIGRDKVHLGANLARGLEFDKLYGVIGTLLPTSLPPISV